MNVYQIQISKDNEEFKTFYVQAAHVEVALEMVKDFLATTSLDGKPYSIEWIHFHEKALVLR